MHLLLSLALATTFTEHQGDGHSGPTSPGTGLAAVDLNADGWLDIVSMGTYNSNEGAKLLLQDPTVPLLFADGTDVVAPGLDDRNYDRGAIVVDFDNDGLRDIFVWSKDHAALFRQRPGWFPTWGDPDDAGSADFEILDEDWAQVNEPGNPNTVPSLNFEGMGVVDRDRDGVLDIQATYRFMHFSEPGLPSVSWEYGAFGLPDDDDQDDDYAAMEDFDGDGVLDILLGREGPDLFLDGPAGFTPTTGGVDLNDQPYKGGILACDFDDDGDLDFFRTTNPDSGNSLPDPVGSSNRIWLNDGTGSFVDGGNPGVDVLRPTWGAACGDLENDGDLDLVVGFVDGGLDIFRNDGNGGWFQDDGGAESNGSQTRAVVLADFDRDGALDLYFQETGGNELYENDLQSNAFVSVEVLANVGTCANPILRDDVHARLRVGDGTGAWSGVRMVHSANGTGLGGGNPVHIGLGSMSPFAPLNLSVVPWSPRTDGTDELTTVVAVTPADHPFQHLSIRTDDPDGDGIPNALEGTADSDGDGTPDRAETDSDGDGLLDVDEAIDPCDPSDADGDGLYDFQESDSDGDGVPDGIDCDRLDPGIGILSFWADGDGDGYGAGAQVQACTAPSGFASTDGDCNDGDASVNPGADEDCDPVDRNCDGNPTLGATDTQTGWLDLDSDTFGDASQSIDVCVLPPGYVGNALDCDDGNASANPAATEVCDGADNDCDGTADGSDATDATDWWPDTDNDTYGAGTAVRACTQPVGHRDNDLDCDDSNGSAFPGAPEQCNSADDDCDGTIDEDLMDSTWYPDGDGDGFGVSGGQTVVSCSQPLGHALQSGDCDDADATVNPAAVETCNGLDDNCTSGESDAVDVSTWYADADGDGWGDAAVLVQACAAPPNHVAQAADCDDLEPTVNPAAVEICDGVDQDCNLLVDDNALDLVLVYLDADGDGFGDPANTDAACPQSIPSGFTLDDSDCDDLEPLAWTDAPEVCDGVDNDCDLLLDFADPDLPPGSTSLWYIDQDNDGFGAGAPLDACTPPSGYVQADGDCDDLDALVNPLATEIPDNGLDDDCDGVEAESEPDRDGDGLADALEQPGDYDGDGLDNIDDPDSDDDGVLDGAEPSLEAVLNAGDVPAQDAPTPVTGCTTTPTSGLAGAMGVLAILARRRRCAL